jgi:hypothetical protein
MARRIAMFAGLLALPIALLVALPLAVPGIGLSTIPGWHVVTDGKAHPAQPHHGRRVRVTGGAVGQLRPGVSVPVALTLQNPNRHRIRMMRVRVRIAAILAPRADAAHPCTKADFAVRQMPRSTLRLRARRTTDLAALGVPVESWPWLTMLNRPLNQDGCQDAQLILKFKARRLRR